MPIVFVHGVNTRDSQNFRDSEARRNGFLREIVAPALGLPANELLIISPFWGGSAAKFYWNMAVLPDASEPDEKFGSANGSTDEVEDIAAQSGFAGSLVDSARHSLAETVDLIYSAALATTIKEQTARSIARSYLRATAYADDCPAPAWLNEQVSNKNFAGELLYHMNADSEDESLGADNVLADLNAGVSRLVNFVPGIVTKAVLHSKRRSLNETIARFVGDAMVYIRRRGTQQDPGPIVNIVLDALREASAKKSSPDDKLIVIAHSFGGAIIYDIASIFAPEIAIDFLITVGSQVGLFEEMKMYVASDTSIAWDGVYAQKVSRPQNVTRWLNVFDLQDVFSYRMDPVFTSIHDFSYSSGYSSLHAHSGYFTRPDFYRRLAARISNKGPNS
jgi:hypothetical protein